MFISGQNGGHILLCKATNLVWPVRYTLVFFHDSVSLFFNLHDCCLSCQALSLPAENVCSRIVCLSSLLVPVCHVLQCLAETSTQLTFW